jgi:hypothetical protein
MAEPRSWCRTYSRTRSLAATSSCRGVAHDRPGSDGSCARRRGGMWMPVRACSGAATCRAKHASPWARSDSGHQVRSYKANVRARGVASLRAARVGHERRHCRGAARRGRAVPGRERTGTTEKMAGNRVSCETGWSRVPLRGGSFAPLGMTILRDREAWRGRWLCAPVRPQGAILPPVMRSVHRSAG